MLKDLFSECSLKELQSEGKNVIWLAWPIIVTMLLHLLTSCTSVIFCGHLGKEVLDSISLASMIVNVFGFAVTMGLASACDTLFAQSYGSSNKAHVGIAFQRGIIILLLMCLPSIAIFIITEHLLVLVGQEPYIARIAGRYTKIFIAGFPGMALSQVLRRFVYIQGLVAPQIIVMVLANVVNVSLHAGLIYGAKMKVETADACLLVQRIVIIVTVFYSSRFCCSKENMQLPKGMEWYDRGAAIAFSVTNWSVAIFFALYIFLWKKYEGLINGFSKECFHDWGEFFGLAVPGMLMLLMEWTSAEVITLICGLLGEEQLAAYTITYNTAMFVSMIPIGLSFGITVRLGINLGAGRAHLAKITSRFAMLMAFLLSCLIAITTLCLHTVIPHIFTEDRDVLELAKQFLYFLAMYLFFCGAEQVLDGVIRGSGNQFFGSVINITAYLLVCLPIAIPIMLKTNLGAKGGYLGLAAGTLYQTSMFLFCILRMDWDREVELALKRSRVTTPNEGDHHELEEYPGVSENGSYQEISEHDHRQIQVHPKGLAESSIASSYGAMVEDTHDLKVTSYSCEETVNYSSKENLVKDNLDKSNGFELNKQAPVAWLIVKRFTLTAIFVTLVGVAVWLDQYLNKS